MANHPYIALYVPQCWFDSVQRRRPHRERASTGERDAEDWTDIWNDYVRLIDVERKTPLLGAVLRSVKHRSLWTHGSIGFSSFGYFLGMIDSVLTSRFCYLLSARFTVFIAAFFHFFRVLVTVGFVPPASLLFCRILGHCGILQVSHIGVWLHLPRTESIRKNA